MLPNSMDSPNKEYTHINTCARKLKEIAMKTKTYASHYHVINNITHREYDDQERTGAPLKKENTWQHYINMILSSSPIGCVATYLRMNGTTRVSVMVETRAEMGSLSFSKNV